MGTAGGIAAIDISSSKEFLITNADVLTDANYRNILQSYKKSKADMLVSAIEHQYRVPYGVLWHNNGKVTDLEEKPTVTFQTNAIYVVSNKALSLIQKMNFLI